ncbi:MAG: hypothetical protein WAQ53_07140 [Thiofilum sp.]|uniref:hypothetical protein n=1 Tax=Thiofilum sp. TaxID=2212733 RepID=UPI0025F28844|nr:hypothetical protein [Thiofilum sp.]MBK8455144.1 hypothetical protein [Thiofilum sp.]
MTDQPKTKYLSTKDIASKALLKRMAADMANLLLGLDVDPNSVELLETEKERIEQRRADLVIKARSRPTQEIMILHIEIQNNNQAIIPWRMLRYYHDIRMEHSEPLQQYLLYIGKERCTMPNSISEPHLSYEYELVDMHTVDCQTLLERNTPEALVLAILCDFKGRPANAVVREIGSRLRLLMVNDDKGFLDYFSMLEILGQNRDLEQQIKETKEMLTQVDVSRLPSYQWGREDTLKELEALMAEKDSALQEKESVIQRTQIVLQEKESVIQRTQIVLQEKESVIQQTQIVLQEKESVIQQKDLLLEQSQKEKQQQTLKLIKKMHLAGMSASVIAELLEVPQNEVEEQLRQIAINKN